MTKVKRRIQPLKEATIIEVIVNNWTDVLRCGDSLRGYVYRGQADKDWPLATSLERISDAHETVDWSEYERLLLQDFKRRAPFYLEHIPPDNEPLEWASLLQHYGAPTRLLDVTDSFHVALFFAVGGYRKPSAVWCFDALSLQYDTSPNHRLSIMLDRLVHTDSQVTRDYVNSSYGKDGPLGLVQVRPYFLHPRLRIQQGSFLYQVRTDSYFERNLAEVMNIRHVEGQRLPAPIPVHIRSLDSRGAILSKRRASVIKVVVMPSAYAECHAELRRLNITAESLFPGLDGFARSLHYPFQMAGRVPRVSSRRRHARAVAKEKSLNGNGSTSAPQN